MQSMVENSNQKVKQRTDNIVNPQYRHPETKLETIKRPVAPQYHGRNFS